MQKYDHKKLDQKWRDAWGEANVYQTTDDLSKEKFYILDMFPYPSGAGLHVGHPKGYIATDIISRYKKMKGYNVLHPMGWDAFGLPAEQHALKNKVHPSINTNKNIARYKEQLEKISLNYDWEREISTTAPEFYKWTQWAFIQMFKKGLVYESNEPINWCPSCKTGLANEDLEDGKCERCDSEIEQKPIRQWVIKITDYADRLLADIDKLDWQESIKESQRNWIGRSEGAEIDFAIKDSKEKIKVFTTRPDTLFGATYMVLAPEHNLISNLEVQLPSLGNVEEVREYVKQASKKSHIERGDMTKEKTGVELKGVKAINPANNEEIPVYIADYVMADYGTGAIMAVPAHDERDFEFAKKFKMPTKVVIKDKDEYRDIDQEKQLAFLKDLYDVANKIDSNGLVIVGGIARSIHKDAGKKFFHSDIDLFATKEVFNAIEKYILKLGFSEEQDGSLDIYNWKNKKAFSSPNNKDIWLDMFLFENNEKNIVDTITGQEFIWDAGDIIKVECSGINIMIPDKKLLESIYQNMASTVDYFSPDSGILIQSGEFDGMDSVEVKKAITEFVGGKMTTSYKLRDWVFARQRYWGEPIPLIHCQDGCGVVPVPEEELPLVLPEVESYEPTGTGESPLAGIEEWVNTKCPKCGGAGKRETNTMPQWAGSSWYYLRYIDPKNSEALVDKKKEKYWSPVDFYVGGAEHATRHLIYARFWHKFLYDIGVVSYDEPFKKLQTVGLIMAEDGRKMSKRWGNVVNPDDVIDEYGADTFRLYEMFMGPFDQAASWSSKGLSGPKRFLDKVWRVRESIIEETPQAVERQLHQTIKKVGEDISDMKYNTAISEMMILVNVIEKEKGIAKCDFESFLKILSPFTPHITQELWSELGRDTFLLEEEWPSYDESKLVEDTMTIVLQVNGKNRSEVIVSVDSSEDEIKKLAMADKIVDKWIKETGKGEVKRFIYITGRLANIVVQ